MFLKKNEKINGSRSITLALELTRKMAEVLLGTKLTLVEFGIDAAKIQGKWGQDSACRTVKTDCEFADEKLRKHTAVAWVKVNRRDGRWIPWAKTLFIQLDDQQACRMEYNVPTTTIPLPDPTKTGPFRNHIETSEYDPGLLDFSRIR